MPLEAHEMLKRLWDFSTVLPRAAERPRLGCFASPTSLSSPVKWALWEHEIGREAVQFLHC